LFDGKKVLITGGTGSLGKALAKRILETDVDTVRIFSRDEFKQIQMEGEFDDKRLRFLIGDVRDKGRLKRALENVNLVIHTAALKHVHVAEYNPFEVVKTNVYGSQNLIEACLDTDVEQVLAIGTDKAVSPLNTYGATKLLMERLFISANNYKGFHKIKFSCVRYGNVLGSRGSLVPILVHQVLNGKKITITDPNMTRFNITMNQALDLIFRAFENSVGGEIFVPKLKAYRTGDVKDAVLELLNPKSEVQQIPVRPGEKYHESLISKDELRKTFEDKKDYLIIDEQIQKHPNRPKNKDIAKTSLKDQYSSDKVELITKDELKKIFVEEKLVSIS
jgi:UDP-N-acetylglucosamine 4,6-dehydratase/UDP-glucose 4-epimerase